MQAAGNNVVHRFRDKITVAPGGDEVMILKTLEYDVSLTVNTHQCVVSCTSCKLCPALYGRKRVQSLFFGGNSRF